MRFSKTIFCTIYYLMFSLGLCAQKDSSNNNSQIYVGIEVGPSIPLAPFNDQIIGQSSLGYTIGVTGEYPVRKSRYRYTVLFNYSQHSFDTLPYKSTNTYPRLNLQYGSFNQESVLLGFCYRYEHKRLNFDFRALLGIAYFQYPYVRWTYEYYGHFVVDTATQYTTPTNIFSPAADIGIGLNLKATQRIILSFNIDGFFSLKNNALYNVESPHSYSSSLHDFLLNGCLSIIYEISKTKTEL